MTGMGMEEAGMLSETCYEYDALYFTHTTDKHDRFETFTKQRDEWEQEQGPFPTSTLFALALASLEPAESGSTTVPRGHGL